MLKGTRARWHYWSRHRGFLLKASLGIIGFGFAVATAVVALVPAAPDPASFDPWEHQLRSSWQHLRNAGPHQPRELARWLRQLLGQLDHVCEVLGIEASQWQSFDKDGKLAHYDVRSLIQKHAADPAQSGLFHQFIAAQLAEADEERAAAAEAIAKLAAENPPPALANELHASLLMRANRQSDALAALIREGRAFPDAATVRSDALRLAVKLKDADSVRELAAEPGWIDQSDPAVQHHAGILLQDLWMQWDGLVRHRLAHVPYAAVGLALFAAGLWYVILIQHGLPLSWRWARPAVPLMAGVFSVWPTLALAGFQEMELGMTEDAPFPHDLWYYLAGVGLREEVCKLAIFALFLPWLLWRRTSGMALMTGAFVGLGFALEENINYYQEFGGGVAVIRFLSANFLHAALTGIASHALYDMLRTRFATADRFIATLLAVVVAHGVYDYAPASNAEGLDWIALIILALVAWRFFDLVALEIPVHANTVAPAAIFSLGTSTLIAVVLILAACQNPQMASVAAAAQECVAIAPIAFIYWRRFETDTNGF